MTEKHIIICDRCKKEENMIKNDGGCYHYPSEFIQFSVMIVLKNVKLL